MVNIAINKAHYPVTVLGPGRRIGLWLQGCRIQCAGCVAQDTWAADPGRVISVARLLTWCKSVTEKSAETLEGITISGGEPFDQPKALAALLDALHLWRRTSALPLDILCYSGYPLKTLQKRHAALLQKLDALIPEPYVDAAPLTQLWRGSANQSLILRATRRIWRQRRAILTNAFKSKATGSVCGVLAYPRAVIWKSWRKKPRNAA